ncbi:MAG: nuclear transport factor 2 family protein [Parachlamydiaceae bacterium]|nr:nuclear transport factor 2 family protein [Parachlamydiaceae bacterium]
MFLTQISNAVSKVFNVRPLIYILLGLLTISQASHANDCSHDRNPEKSLQKFARELVTEFWTDVQNKDVKAFSKLMALNFQGLNIAGAFTRSEQIAGLSSLNIQSFKIQQLVATRDKNTIVITYDFIAIGDATNGPSIDVWSKTARHWKLVSHSYVPLLP